ncbi:hypothetical protein DB347_05240 [Opitutaceae bacterium EW11]|nr:hypothetical protein DB347_05240 [Opitutaceae bacterium EW11]
MKARVRSGFTLLEVLIALAIFAMAAVVLGASYINVLMSYESADKAVQRNEDVEFARAALLTETDRETVEKGADFESGPNRHVTWKATLEQTETPDVFLVNFECTITSPDLKQPEKILQTFRVLRPTWSKGDERDTLRAKTRDRITKIITTQK